MKKVINIAIMVFLFTFTIRAQEKTVQIKTSAQCDDCKKKIETALNYAKGVKSAHLDVASKTVEVTYDSLKTNSDKIRLVISKAGYDADSIPADPKAYERLKPCCRKDGTTH